MKFKAYKTNIEVLPVSKNKIIGNTAKNYLYGEVISIGEEVKSIKVGDIIGYTLWGLTEIEQDNGEKQLFVKDDPDFILGIYEA
jgi:hypothetical protein